MDDFAYVDVGGTKYYVSDDSKTPLIGKGINLLDNSYFVGGGSQQGGGQFPINQRGQTSYSNAGYGVDRWTSSGNLTLTINSGYVTLSQSAAWQSLLQYVDTVLSNVPYTISILYKATTGHYFGVQYADGTSLSAQDYFGSSNWNLNSITFTPNGVDKIRAIIGAASGGCVFDIIAAKLELGTQQTLAHQDASGNWVLNDPPPNYATELAKCQRYYYKWSGHYFVPRFTPEESYGCIPFPVTMRATPKITDLTYNEDWGMPTIPFVTANECTFYGASVPPIIFSFSASADL